MRAALIVAILPGWARGEPTFWRRFDAAAPWTLRWGTWGAAWLVVALAPFVAGATWGRLEAPARSALVARLAAWPLVGDALELAKLAACWEAFDDDAAQARWRSG